MIQINLVPDVKQEFLKAQRTKRVVITFSVLVGGFFLAITTIMFLLVNVWQQRTISNNDTKITELLGEYRELDDVSKVLTLNSQLTELPILHEDKTAITRLRTYLARLVPDGIKLTNFTMDQDQTVMVMEGIGPDIAAVNKFADTLKNAVYFVYNPTFQDNPDIPNEIPINKVFNTVILEQVGTENNPDSGNETERRATYEIRVVYNPEIFDNSLDVRVIVPRTSSDELELIQPESLVDANLLIIEERDQRRGDDLFEPTPEIGGDE